MKIQVTTTKEHDVSEDRTCLSPRCDYLDYCSILDRVSPKDGHYCSLFETILSTDHICHGGMVVWKCDECLEACELPVWKPIPDYGDKMTIDEFIDYLESGGINMDDGCGNYATATQICDNKEVHFMPERVRREVIKYPEFTHVIWFNK